MTPNHNEKQEINGVGSFERGIWAARESADEKAPARCIRATFTASSSIPGPGSGLNSKNATSRCSGDERLQRDWGAFGRLTNARGSGTIEGHLVSVANNDQRPAASMKKTAIASDWSVKGILVTVFRWPDLLQIL